MTWLVCWFGLVFVCLGGLGFEIGTFEFCVCWLFRDLWHVLAFVACLLRLELLVWRDSDIGLRGEIWVFTVIYLRFVVCCIITL